MVGVGVQGVQGVQEFEFARVGFKDAKKARSSGVTEYCFVPRCGI
jgi:hypothetical protein